MAYYPRVKAKSIIPRFDYHGNQDSKECKPMCFYGFKAGMTNVQAKNAHKGSVSYGQEISLPVSVIEVPGLKVIGARFYKSNSSVLGKKATIEFLVKDNVVARKIKGKKEKKEKTIDEFLSKKDNADELTLLCSLNPKEAGFGQKHPAVIEIPLTGTLEQQISYLKEKFNKKISADEVFTSNDYLDIKGVTKGKGTQGPVKRFGIKVLRPKHQIQRHVGSIGPWHPATIMYNVPRAGQMGFHNRTEHNKRLLMIGEDASKINPKGGFQNYGLVKNKYLVISGSIPGVSRRIIAMRKGIRKVGSITEVTDITFI
jgi:large subunit ribosomal protein L3